MSCDGEYQFNGFACFYEIYSVMYVPKKGLKDK